PMIDTSQPVAVPRIHADRVWLREYRVTDFDAFAANLADPLAKASHKGVVDRPEAWRQFLAGAGNWMLTGRGGWAIERKDEPGLVGTVGVFLREGFPDPFEIGW